MDDKPTTVPERGLLATSDDVWSLAAAHQADLADRRLLAQSLVLGGRGERAATLDRQLKAGEFAGHALRHE